MLRDFDAKMGKFALLIKNCFIRLSPGDWHCFYVSDECAMDLLVCCKAAMQGSE